MDPASPQRDALPRAPTLDLTLPEVLDGLRQQEDSEDGEDGDVDSNVDSDGEEEVKSKEEEERPKYWADQVEAEKFARYLASQVCGTAGCKNPLEGGIQCPECEILHIVKGRFFCSQACFASSWTLHDEGHKKAPRLPPLPPLAYRRGRVPK